MRIGARLAVAVVCLFTLSGASAKTPDGQTPAEEQICTDAGLSGNLFGLCNAYCEAMDCDSPSPHASPKACSRVYDNFVRASGGQVPPCLKGEEVGQLRSR